MNNQEEVSKEIKNEAGAGSESSTGVKSNTPAKFNWYITAIIAIAVIALLLIIL